MKKVIISISTVFILTACGSKTESNANKTETNANEASNTQSKSPSANLTGENEKTWINSTDGIDRKTWFVEFKFNADGTYSGKFDNGKEDSGEWTLEDKTLILKNVFTLKSELVELTETQFKIKTTSGTILTFRVI